MSDEGPTSVGSINAKLTLDYEVFIRKMDEAGEKADRLDGRTINVKADADTGKAQASLDALQMAENRLRIAQLNLDDVNKKSTATEQEKLRAQNALMGAQQSYNKILADRQRFLQGDTDAEERNTRAKWEGVSAMSAFVALSPAALAGAATLAAGAAGLGAGFLGMGTAGVLAIRGISAEMDAGTEKGVLYRAGLRSLEGDLDQLSHTAAVSMLQSFLGAVDDINERMPVLNRLTGDMSSALGNVAGGALNAFLTGLERAEPLIDDGALYLSRFVGWLDSFASSNGFQDFLAYADANLPRVTDLLEDVVTLGGHLLASLAPLGPVVIDSLGALVNILNRLPLPVLAGLVATAAALPGAFGLARGAVALFGETTALARLQVSLFGASVNLAVPVIGIFTAALAGIAAGAMAATASQQELSFASQQYADAIREDNGLLGENMKLQAAKALVDSGAAQAAERLGIGMDTLVGRITGNADATKVYNDRINDLRNNMIIADNTQGAYGDGSQQVRQDVDLVTGAVQGQTGAVKDAADKYRLGIQVTQEFSGAQQEAAAGSAAMKTALDAIGLSTSGAITQLDKFIQDLEAAGLASISADQASIRFHDTIDAVTASVKQNGKTLDVNTAAGRANKTAFDNLAQSGLTAADSMAKNGDSVQAVRGQLNDTYGSLIKAAGQFGITGDQADAMARKVMGIPPNVTVDAWMQDHASAALDAVAGKAHAVDGTVVNIFTVEHLQQLDERSSTNDPDGVSRMGHYSRGGDVAYLAAGGVHPLAFGTDTVPAMLTPREFVVNQPASDSLRRNFPGALEYMNRTGQLPMQQAAPQGPFVVSGDLYLDSGEFLGKVQGVARAVALDVVGSAFREAALRRPRP